MEIIPQLIFFLTGHIFFRVVGMLYYFQLMLAGIAGTLFMSIYIKLYSVVIVKGATVVKVLGNMLLSFNHSGKHVNHQSQLLIGTLVYYATGIFVSCIIGWLWNKQIILPTVYYAVLTGFAAGFIAICIWLVFFKMHPHPPKLHLTQFLFYIFSGCIVFSLGQLYSFLLLNNLFNLANSF